MDAVTCNVRHSHRPALGAEASASNNSGWRICLRGGQRTQGEAWVQIPTLSLANSLPIY